MEKDGQSMDKDGMSMEGEGLWTAIGGRFGGMFRYCIDTTALNRLKCRTRRLARCVWVGEGMICG